MTGSPSSVLPTATRSPGCPLRPSLPGGLAPRAPSTQTREQTRHGSRDAEPVQGFFHYVPQSAVSIQIWLTSAFVWGDRDSLPGPMKKILSLPEDGGDRRLFNQLAPQMAFSHLGCGDWACSALSRKPRKVDEGPENTTHVPYPPFLRLYKSRLALPSSRNQSDSLSTPSPPGEDGHVMG